MSWRAIPVLVGAWLVSGQMPPASEWTRADLAMVRLSPARIPRLPPAIRKELEGRGCTIPQPFTAKPDRPENATTGHFTSAAATDWAILCSRQRRSSILVFRGGGVEHVDELAEEADADRLQEIGQGRIGYSRWIAAASPDDIRKHNPDAHPPLPPLDHDGLHDAFIEKASVVLYWSGSTWLTLTGATAPPGARD